MNVIYFAAYNIRYLRNARVSVRKIQKPYQLRPKMSTQKVPRTSNPTNNPPPSSEQPRNLTDVLQPFNINFKWLCPYWRMSAILVPLKPELCVCDTSH